MRSIREINVKNKRVLVRCDFNVPLDNQGNILDDFRIKETLPTIKYLMEKKAKIILMSHLGEPGGKPVPVLKMDKIQERLMEYLDCSITKAPDCVGPEIEKHTFEIQTGEVLLLENLRFHKEETSGDLKFAKQLSRLGDIYINDAFSVCHRAHASITGVPKYLPTCSGLLLEKEIKNLKKIIESPKTPLVAIIGGKKVETKAALIDKISELADFILLGDLIADEIKEKKIPVRYPQKLVNPIDSIIKDGKKLDIGPKTIKIFKEKIATAKTIFWNGPLGQTEKEKFSKGSSEIAKAIIDSKAFSVVGGGETVEFLNRLGLAPKFSHVSTGGGAMLAYLGGEKLPGLEALG